MPSFRVSLFVSADQEDAYLRNWITPEFLAHRLKDTDNVLNTTAITQYLDKAFVKCLVSARSWSYDFKHVGPGYFPISNYRYKFTKNSEFGAPVQYAQKDEAF